MPPAIARSLSRLSREKILDLCATWAKSPRCEPYLTTNRDICEVDEEDYLHEPATSRSELIHLYAAQKENASPLADLEDWTKKDLIDRIIDGDWRRGLSYEQLASIDFAALEENDTAMRWSALRLVPLVHDSNNDNTRGSRKRRKLDTNPTTTSRTLPPHYPQTTAAEFVKNLRTHISPLVKAHSHLHRLPAHHLSVVRLCIVPHAPFAPLSTNVPRSEKTALDSSRTIFIALPDSCPYVYVSMSGTASHDQSRAKHSSTVKGGRQKVDAAATKRIVLEAIPKALSRPQQRWALQSTSLTAKSLRAMTLLRGNCKPGVTGGVFSSLSGSLQISNYQQVRLSDTNSAPKEERQHGRLNARQKRIEQRFGAMGDTNRAKLDRVQFRIKNLSLQRARPSKKRSVDAEQDQYEGQEEPAPMTITLSGSDVFAGLKQLAAIYPDLVDLGRLPSAFTGEGSTSIVTL